MATREKMSKIDKAYIAGFFDGEGSCGLYISTGYTDNDGIKHHYHYVRASIGNTDKDIPELCKNLFGGSLSEEIPLNGLKVYRWYGTGKVANDFLKTIVLFLRQKKYRAQKLLEYFTKRDKLSWEDKEKIRLEFIALNGMSGKSHRSQRLSEKTP